MCVSQTLRELVYEKEGQTVATKLISVMVTEALEAGGAGAGERDRERALNTVVGLLFRSDDRFLLFTKATESCVSWDASDPTVVD